MKVILIILTGILVSFGFFPFEFMFLPGMNTKMIMAGIGLIIITVQSGINRNSVMDKDFLMLLVYGGWVSLVGFASTVYNNTTDYTYATYVVSMLVWLSSSYVIVLVIHRVHGSVSAELVINYLVAVCVAQCILALAIDMYTPLKSVVNGILASEGFMGKNESRLYGLGCSLDVAGTRLGAVLIMIACLCMKVKSQKLLALYLAAMVIIVAIGNMISRTTIIGFVMALLYWVYVGGLLRFDISKESVRVWKGVMMALVIALPVIIYAYYSNDTVHHNIRFAFEGFFSLAEKGRWEVTSNDRLLTMIVFPDNLKTWVIGDGYFNNPLSSDYHYIGFGIGDYYMYTDIGYLRFVFYFGVVGAILFCCYMFKVADICVRRFKGYEVMFVFLLLLNYTIWCKVASDIFLVFALFLCIKREDEEVYHQQLSGR